MTHRFGASDGSHAFACRCAKSVATHLIMRQIVAMGTRNADGGLGTSLPPVQSRNSMKRTLLATALTLVSSAALAQAPAPAPAAAGLDGHRQRRHLQRIHLPRHLADRRQACGAGRLRLSRTRAASTLGTWASNISWLAGLRRLQPSSSLEWDFYGGFKANFGDPTGSGTSARSTTTTPANAIPASSPPTPGRSTARSAGSGSSVKASATASTTTSALRPNGKKTDGTYYVDFYGDLSGRRDRASR